MIFLLLPLLGVVISGILSFYVLPPVYEAKTILMVTQSTDLQNTAINTFAGQIKSDVLMQRVTDSLQLNESVYSTSHLAKQIQVTAPKDSNLLEITVSNRDPSLSASIANALTSQFNLLMVEKNQEMVERTVSFLRSQIASIQKEMTQPMGAQERMLLEDTLVLLTDKARLTRSIDLGSTSVVVISPAVSPAAPAKPDKTLNIILGFIMGLMVSTALAFAKEALDNTVRNHEDVANNLNLPVLGAILYPDRHARK